MKEAWVVSLRDQCQDQEVPFFFKQWGAFNCEGRRVGKSRAGRLLHGRIWNEVPISRGVPVASD